MIHVVTEKKKAKSRTRVSCLPTIGLEVALQRSPQRRADDSSQSTKEEYVFILSGFPKESTSWVYMGSGELLPSKINVASMTNNGFSLTHSEFVTSALTCSLPGLGSAGNGVPAPAESWWPGKT